MANPFFDHPVINSPYEYPSRHWELDETGQPTQKTIDRRRSAEFITPIPKPRKRKKQADQGSLFISELSTKEQEYDHTATINAVRREVHAIDAVGKRLYEAQWGPANIAPRDLVQRLIEEARGRVEDAGFSARFLMGEWEDEVDAWQLRSIASRLCGALGSMMN